MDLTWVEQTEMVDAIDPVVRALEQNPGYRLIGTGTGSGGQTTLTYGWPWRSPSPADPVSVVNQALKVVARDLGLSDVVLFVPFCLSQAAVRALVEAGCLR